MLDRLVITFLVIGGLALLWLSWNYYKTKLIKNIQATQGSTSIDKPTLLYFTAEYCAACKFQQAPIVEKLIAKFGDSVAIKKFDVSQHPDVASQYKVLTLPTTVVLKSNGQVVHVNYGVTRQSKLEMQLS